MSTAAARVLIVEDELIVAHNLQRKLQRLGYTVPAVVATGEEAIDLVGTTHPDVVLMDIRLAGMIDGVATAEQIRLRFNIPVIYLTAYVDTETIQRAKLTEPLGYIPKPFEIQHLHTAIEMAMYRHTMERKIRESERWLATILHSIGDAVIATDAAGQIKFMNPTAERFTGWLATEALGHHLDEVLVIIDETTRQPLENLARRAFHERVVVNLDNQAHALLVARDGTERAVVDSAAPIHDDHGSISGVVMVLFDITERQRMARERELLIASLELALANIKTLRGLIPICASCKKIRNDHGYWTKLEIYLQEHSEADFSHGICPDCARRLYGEEITGT